MSVIVYSDGRVFFSQPTSIKSACALNIADFPFDDQVCQLTFGSWTMDSTLLRLDLYNEGIDLTYFIRNNMWDLLEISPDMRRQMYPSHDNELSVVVYTIALRRRALFFVVNYIAPPVAISFLSLLLFLIPPEVGKRMGKGCFFYFSFTKVINSPSKAAHRNLTSAGFACSGKRAVLNLDPVDVM